MPHTGETFDLTEVDNYQHSEDLRNFHSRLFFKEIA